jgi:hypothetical protein
MSVVVMLCLSFIHRSKACSVTKWCNRLRLHSIFYYFSLKAPSDSSYSCAHFSLSSITKNSYWLSLPTIFPFSTSFSLVFTHLLYFALTQCIIRWDNNLLINGRQMEFCLIDLFLTKNLLNYSLAIMSLFKYSFKL